MTNQTLLKNTSPALVRQMMSPFKQEEFKEKFLLAVKNEFAPYKAKCTALVDIAAKLSITNEDGLNTAKGHILDTAAWLKIVEASHKEIKSPLKILVDIIDAEKKSIVDSITSSKSVLSSKISFWEILEKKKKEEALRAALVIKQTEDKVIMEDTKMISRIVSNLRAMIFGGEMVTLKATTQRPGCSTLDELAAVEAIVSSKLPSVSLFHKDCVATYVEAITMINEMVIGRKTSIMNGSTVLSDIEMTVISNSTEITANQMSNMERSTRKAEKAIEDTQKGFRRTIQYEVLDINRIPREYLMIDESKINDYKIAYREQILEQLKSADGTGHGFIEGIRFSVDMVSIVH